MMRTHTMASVADDEAIARQAIQAALGVLQESGLKAEDPTIDWSRSDFPEVRQVLTAARTAIRRTLSAEYHRRQLRTTG